MMENVGYNMKTPNLKFILETLLDDAPKPTTPQEKQQFMQEIKNFSAMAAPLDRTWGSGLANISFIKAVLAICSIVLSRDRDFSISGVNVVQPTNVKLNTATDIIFILLNTFIDFLLIVVPLLPTINFSGTLIIHAVILYYDF